MLKSSPSEVVASRDSSPLVTIGMPVRNCEKTIGPAIRSILNQTHGNWELLVIDDGSSDGTVRQVRGFRDSRIRVFADGLHRGIAPRLNEAVRSGRGEYFARMDGDDVSFPERLALQVAWLERNAGVDLLGAGVVVFRGSGELLGTRAIALTHEEICRRPHSGFPLPHPTWIGRTEWFRNHPYRPDALRAEDQDLLLRTYRTSTFASLPEVLLGYREEKLRLGKILRGRSSYLLGTIREARSERKIVSALAAVCEHAAKAAVETVAITTGLDYAILRHRAMPADPALAQRWSRVWKENQEERAASSGTNHVIFHSSGTEPPNAKLSEPGHVAARPGILYAGTSPLSVQWFLRGQLGYLREAGFDVTVITAPGEGLDEARRREGVRTVAVPMVRHISPARDLVALWRLWRILRRMRPAITNVGTPKAGLLAGLAAWFTGVPCRVYTLHGLRLETARGSIRLVLWLAEWLACRAAHRVICVSESVRRKALALRLVAPERAVVLGAGSCNGVDESGCAPGSEAKRRASELRRSLGIPSDAPVIGFIGRLTRDKGIPELVNAYFRLRPEFPGLRLLLVGDFEEGDPVNRALHCRIDADSRIFRTGFVRDVLPYYHVVNVLALPTYREGFPNVVLEAQASGKPVVATRATGVVDAITDGVDGILVPIGDPAALAESVARLLRDPNLASRLGRAGRERALLHFRHEDVWTTLLREYVDLLSAKGLPLPRTGENALAGFLRGRAPASNVAFAPLKPGRWFARQKRHTLGAP